MLIGPFQVQVGRLDEFFAALEHADVRRARVEPYVQGIGHLAPVFRFVAEQFFFGQRKPRFDAVFLDSLRDLFEQFTGARVQFFGLFVNEQCHWRTPATLA